jgi:hypothetical protein
MPLNWSARGVHTGCARPASNLDHDVAAGPRSSHDVHKALVSAWMLASVKLRSATL